MHLNPLALALLFAPVLSAQVAGNPDPATLQEILQRLNSLEEQNQSLLKEVRMLRDEVRTSQLQAQKPATQAAARPANEQSAVEERLAVAEQRIDEQAQTKVEASQKLPLSLTGMVLFNAFANSRAANTAYTDDLLNGPSRTGATLRQTLIGLSYQGPSLPGSGRVHGDLMMDFFSGSSYPTRNWLRIRRGIVSLDWERRSFTVGQDKPLVSLRAPESLAEVGVPPLAGAGNLWVWIPQSRYEERVHFGSRAGMTPQVAFLQTNENYARVPSEYSASLAQSRPAIEGRVAFWFKPDDAKRFEIAPSFHASTTHIAGNSVESRLLSVDWLVRAWPKLELTGDFFHGRNFANIGGLAEGFAISEDTGRVSPIHGTGGWVQAESPLTSRLTLHLFAGEQQNRARDLVSTDTQRSLTYAGNLIYRLAPNVLVGIEALQARKHLAGSGDRLQNHYDLSLAYLF